MGVFLNRIDIFLLVFVRMTGLFVIAPVFGRRNIPTYFKIGFSLFLAIIMMNTIKTQNISQYDNIYSYGFLIIKEFLVGIVIGYVSYLFFTSIYLAGQFIDMQIGFGMVSVLDPVSNIQIPVTANFYSIISTLIFLMINGHHSLINALFESFNILPLGSAVFDTRLLNDLTSMFGNMFVVGFKISAPIIASILIADVLMGVIAKTMPQMNFFVVGMPLKIIFGITILMFTVQAFSSYVDYIINDMNEGMFTFIKDMGSLK